MRRRVTYALLACGVTLVCTTLVLIGMPRHFGTEPIAVPIIASVMTGATAYGQWPRNAERRDGIGMIAIGLIVVFLAIIYTGFLVGVQGLIVDPADPPTVWERLRDGLGVALYAPFVAAIVFLGIPYVLGGFLSWLFRETRS